MEFTRIGDDSYLIKTQGDTFIIDTPKELGTPEIRTALLQLICTMGIDITSTDSIKLGNREWKLIRVKPHEQLGFLERIGMQMNQFFFPPTEQGVKRFRLEEQKATTFAIFARSDTTQFDVETGRILAESLRNRSLLNPLEIQSGLRGKMPLESPIEMMTNAPFTDPFSILASKAFQEYEPNYSSKDYFKSDQCTMMLAVSGGDLVLKPHIHGKVSPEQINENRITVNHFQSQMIKLYGPSKVEYVAHLMGIDFREMNARGDALTPEHVYRMNIGMTNIETHDLKEASVRLNTLFKALITNEGKYADENLIENALIIPPMSEILWDNDIRCIRRVLTEAGKEPTVANLKEWLLSNNFEAVSPDKMHIFQVDTLMKVYGIRPDDREKALTGRAIFETILGWYNNNELNEYKPWLDQQQLIQAISEYEINNDWVAFYEILAFVICKMQMVREHPKEGFRVGTLIPAPQSEAGERQWYKVSSCVSNGYGIFAYTLEGVGMDSTLPAIKLYRSTAASPYCMHGAATPRCDFNPINSPGYEGTGLGDHYEREFFDERSVPVWSAYGSIAHSSLERLGETPDTSELSEIFNNLKLANAELKDSYLAPFQIKGIEQIIREHDYILNDLAVLPASMFGFVSGSRHCTARISKFLKQMNGIQDRYLKRIDEAPPPSTAKDVKIERRDAEELIQTLRDFQKVPLEPHQQIAITHLINELNENIINPTDPIVKERKDRELRTAIQLPILESTTLDACQHFPEQVELHLSSENYGEAIDLLKQWDQWIHNYALAKNEDPSQKKQDAIVIVGHSLGGAAAQSQGVHHTFGRGRIPVKGLDFQCFDDPGINSIDNLLFKQFGSKHSNLLKQMGVSISIHRQQETRDPVSLGGEEHLGATFSDQDFLDMSQWLTYEEWLLNRHEESANKTIASFRTAHATRFQTGKASLGLSMKKEVGTDYTKTMITPMIRGLVDRGKWMTGEEKDNREAAGKVIKDWEIDWLGVGSDRYTKKLYDVKCCVVTHIDLCSTPWA